MKLIGDKLTCERGGRLVFSQLDFDVAAGELLVLTGANGSGKTSLLRLIAGLGEPASGALKLEGGDGDLTIGQHCHFAAHQDAHKPALSVAENLEFWSAFLGGGGIDAALAAFDLTRLRDAPAALLSAGQKKRLALARLKLVPRPIWLLDEPSVGLDKASTARLVSAMQAQLAGHGLIIATTHIDLGMQGTRTLDLSARGTS